MSRGQDKAPNRPSRGRFRFSWLIGTVGLVGAVVLVAILVSGESFDSLERRINGRDAEGDNAPLIQVLAQPPQAPLDPVELKRRSLTDLGTLIENQPGRVSAVLLDMSGKVIFESQPDERHALASVAKVYILAAYLDLVTMEGRELTQQERFLMEAMIEQSDNDSASTLWWRIGGPDGLRDFLDRHGLPQVERAYDNSWGSMRASARDLSVLLTELYAGRLLDEEKTALALDHLANVIDSQAWGVGYARDDGRLGGAGRVYMKNGWYPEADGWIVNSVGVLEDDTGNYVLVLLADAQPTFEAGKRLIAAAVYMVRERLL